MNLARSEFSPTALSNRLFIDNPASAVWFKIDEAGYEDGKWAATDILTGEQNSIWTVTIPAGLKAGQYLVRHELYVCSALLW